MSCDEKVMLQEYIVEEGTAWAVEYSLPPLGCTLFLSTNKQEAEKEYEIFTEMLETGTLAEYLEQNY